MLPQTAHITNPGAKLWAHLLTLRNTF